MQLIHLKMNGEKFSFKADVSMYYCGKIIEYIATLPEEDRVFQSSTPPLRNSKGQFVSKAK